MQVKMSAKQEI